MALSDDLRGAALMTGSMAAFTLNDAFMKGLSDHLPLAQAIFLRGAAATLALAVLAAAMGQVRLRLPRGDLGLLALRTGAEIAAAGFFLTALFNMPIANATAILQVLPLAVTLAGALVFAEPLGWRRLSAILAGFGGVLLIVRPGTDGFTIYALHALAAVAMVTVRDLAARRMTGALPSLTVALVAAAGVTVVFGAVAALQPWQPVSPRAAGLLGGATLFIVAAYILSVSAMRVGALATVAPFRYSGLVVALIVGVTVFGERPDALTLAGAAVIAAAGLYTLARERRLARAAGSAAAAGTRPCQGSVDTQRDSL